MKKIKFLSFVLITFCLVQTVFSQPVGTTFEVIKEQTKNIEGNGQADPRFEDLIVPINDINHTMPWNTSVCTQNPGGGDFYEANSSTDEDVNKLRIFPYTSSTISSNPQIEFHNFWFTFGCCGQNHFCADDGTSQYVHNAAIPDDDTSPQGKLLLKNVDTDYDTSIWINFMTQCEDCTSTTVALGNGVWFKWEEDFTSLELMSISSTFFPSFVVPETQAVVPCVPSALYGCEFGELNN